MDSENTSSVVMNWLFFVSAFFAAGVMVLLAKPMIDNFFSKMGPRKRGCGCSGKNAAAQAPAVGEQQTEIQE